MDWLVPLADLDFDTQEEAAVLEVLHSKWLTLGAVTQEFEVQFSKLIGSKYTIAVSNATEALHLACLALGIGPGDEVIVPSLTFVATANCVLYTGAEVRFADIISPDNLTIDPAEIERLITPRTKAVIVMHYGGYPCQMDQVMAIATHYSLPVIEDAAHAPGASLDGRMLGGIGDIGCFSFFSNKNLATGEGGMLVTNRKEIADKARLLRSHGMTTLTYDRHKGHAYSYDVLDLGYNYRIDELRSALGISQLKKLVLNNSRRAAYTYQYRQGLAGADLLLPFLTLNGQPSYHLFPVLLPERVDRERFIDHMRLKGIQTSIHYPPIHTFSYYQKRYGTHHLPVTEQVASRELTLPLYPTMGEDKVTRVVAAVVQGL